MVEITQKADEMSQETLSLIAYFIELSTIRHVKLGVTLVLATKSPTASFESTQHEVRKEKKKFFDRVASLEDNEPLPPVAQLRDVVDGVTTDDILPQLRLLRGRTGTP